MGFWGGLAGGVLGFLIGGPAGAVVGAAAGAAAGEALDDDSSSTSTPSHSTSHKVDASKRARTNTRVKEVQSLITFNRVQACKELQKSLNRSTKTAGKVDISYIGKKNKIVITSSQADERLDILYAMKAVFDDNGSDSRPPLWEHELQLPCAMEKARHIVKAATPHFGIMNGLSSTSDYQKESDSYLRELRSIADNLSKKYKTKYPN